MSGASVESCIPGMISGANLLSRKGLAAIADFVVLVFVLI